MTLAEGIRTLQAEDFSDDEILANIRKIKPDLNEGIDTLSTEGFSTADIISNIAQLTFEDPKPKKLSIGQSAVAGAIEGAVGPLALAAAGSKLIEREKPEGLELPRDRQGKLLYEKPIEEMSFSELMDLSDDDVVPSLDISYGPSRREKETASPEALDPIGSLLRSMPESEDQTGRRLRTGISAVMTGLPFGVPGAVAGLVGSQAGQTVREVFGDEGKFNEFGVGEGSAILADILSGGAGAIATDVGRGALSGAKASTRQMPVIFEEGNTLLKRAAQKSTIQGEKAALQKTIDKFGQQELRNFETEASRIAPDRFTDLTESSASQIAQETRSAYNNSQLGRISPLDLTPEQGMSRVQVAANEAFQKEVINAERQAYQEARSAAKGLKGSTPKSLNQAKALKSEFMNIEARTPEQEAVVGFLNDFIRTIENRIPAQTTAPSTILNIHGNPVNPGRAIAASSEPQVQSANNLIDLIQRSNQFVNYGSEMRSQSHRLAPLISTLREEVSQVLNPNARKLFQSANNLHAKNADTWGTRFMRNVRFSETPEDLVNQLRKASNMNNFKQAIKSQEAQGIAERQVINQLTGTGATDSNRIAISKLSSQLSPRAKEAAKNLIDIKDPLTTAGGRAAVQTDILKDAAMAVSSGQRPEKIMKLMGNKKGYNLVKESMSKTPQGRELFKSIERLFIEDVISSALDAEGRLDFKKVSNLLGNSEIKGVVKEIGGEALLNRFHQLQKASKNLERNLALYGNPETKTLIKKVSEELGVPALVASIMHLLHVPSVVTVGLGAGLGTYKLGRYATKKIVNTIVENPKLFQELERVTTASTSSALSKQLPRFLNNFINDADDETLSVIESEAIAK